MRRLIRPLWKLLTSSAPHSQPARRTARRRPLELEYLEERTLMATASGVITGEAYLSSTSNHLAMAGVAVTLTGTTSQNTAVKVSVDTNKSGDYTFLNVLPGTYQLKAGPVSGLTNSSTVTVGSFAVAGGQTLTHNLAFTGQLKPASVSISEFLTTSTVVSNIFGPVGTGIANVNYRPNNAPIVAKAVAPVAVTESSSPTNIDLAGSFSDPDMTDSLVTFNITDGTKKVELEVQLFDTQDPQTVANFFDYVDSGAYNNAIFTRLEQAASGLQILQGGAITLNAAGNGFTTIPIINPGGGVPNEFLASNSNTFGTIAMAQSAGNANSGTDQFFFNFGNNSSSLDSQKFVVFGKVVAVSDSVLTLLSKTPTPAITIPATLQSQFPTVSFTDPSSGAATVPLVNFPVAGAFPSSATKNNFVTINSITIDKRDEWLTYSIVSNSDPTLVTPSITNEWLTLTYAADQTGTASIVVEATDRYGATVTQTIKVTVGNAPAISNVAITANNPSAPTTLTATPTSTDPQGLPVTYTYQWMLATAGGTPTAISGQTSQTLTLSAVTGLVAGDTLSVTVTPSDSAPFTGAAFTSSAVTVATVSPITLDLPTVTGVKILPDNALDAATLTAAPSGIDPLGKTLTYTYQWLQDGTAISGQNVRGPAIVRPHGETERHVLRRGDADRRRADGGDVHERDRDRLQWQCGWHAHCG